MSNTVHIGQSVIAETGIDIETDNTENQVASVWSRLCRRSQPNARQINPAEWSGLNVPDHMITTRERVVELIYDHPWSVSFTTAPVISFIATFIARYSDETITTGLICIIWASIFCGTVFLNRGIIHCIPKCLKLCRNSFLYKNLEEYPIKNIEEARELITSISSVTQQTIVGDDSDDSADCKLTDPVMVQKQIYSFKTILRIFKENKLLPHNRQPFNITEIKRVNIESPFIKTAIQENVVGIKETSMLMPLSYSHV
jgi:hypothetical protein